MAVACFTRAERNGMYVIQPLAGPMKHDCLIVNETVHFVYQQLQRGLGLEELTAAFTARALAGRPEDVGNGSTDLRSFAAHDAATREEHIRFDLYRILLALRDREICDFTFDDTLALLPAGRIIKGTTQVMPVALLHEVASSIVWALDHASGVADGALAEGGVINGAPPPPGTQDLRLFYSFLPAAQLNRMYLDAEQILRRHLDQSEVYFVAIDQAGQLEGVTAVQGLPQQPATLRIFLSAARADSADPFENRIGIHLARLCGLLQVTSLSAKIRFQWSTAEDPRATRHELFDRVIAELGFRRSFALAEELTPGDSFIGYDRTLF